MNTENRPNICILCYKVYYSKKYYFCKECMKKKLNKN